MNNIEISFENINTEIDNKNIVKTCDNILKLLNVDNWEISIVFCDDIFIQKLNKEYRNKDESTDVLSFPQTDGMEFPSGDPSMQAGVEVSQEGDPDISENDGESEITVSAGSFYAGDIIISRDTVEKNSNYFKVNKNEELIRLLIHGILHLNGMTHETNNPDQEMLIMQEEILSKITGVDIF